MRLNRDKLWEAIYAFATACGGNVRNYNTSHQRVDAEKAIDNVLDSFQTEFDELTRLLGTASRRVEEKQERLRDIGRACALIKNTAHGDFIMLPGGNKLEVMVTEALKK
jgi:hypothetical protein